MRRALVPTLLVLAFAFGCVTTSLVTSTSQAAVDGTECRSFRLESPRGRDAVALPDGAQSAGFVPRGWQPIGAVTINDIFPTVVACKMP